MATTRTAKGTASSKTSGTTLTVASVSAKRGSFLWVAVAYETSQGVPTAKWGNGDLVRLGFRHNAGASGVAMFARRRVKNPPAKDVVITWPSAIEARAMFVTMLEGVTLKDQVKDRAQDATTTPDSGLTGTLAATNESLIAGFCSEGPSSDAAGTPTASTVAGQRVGTVGAPPISNVTIAEYFELDLATTAAVKARVTGATSRDWAISLVTLEQITETGDLPAAGGTQAHEYTAAEMGAFEDQAFTWMDTAANQTTVNGWLPTGRQNLDPGSLAIIFGRTLQKLKSDF